MRLFAFHIDSSACSGCKTCQAACRDKNDLKPGIKWRRVYEIQGGKWKEENGTFSATPFGYNLSVSCLNCEKPLCMSACPTKAVYENNQGIILIDHELCMGCRYCEWACPYGAPQYDPWLKMMSKCNLCYDKIEEGLKPSCVTACPMRALDFGSFEEISSKYGTLNRVWPLPDPGLTGPGLSIKPHKDSERAENEEVNVSDMEEI